MHFAVITLFPGMLQAVTEYGITGRAVKNSLVQVSSWNPRDYTEDKYCSVDDRPYGGGPGMVMMMPPLCAAIRNARKAIMGNYRVIHLTPQGQCLDHDGVLELARKENLILLCGRYEGIDERVIQTEVDEEWSIGDYILSGGELAAMVLIDAITRTLPNVLGHEESFREDSFFEGILDYPHYTRPEVFEDKWVPEVLLSGDHGKIRRWRLQQALGRTWLRRPELLDRLNLDVEKQQLLDEFIQFYKMDKNQDI